MTITATAASLVVAVADDDQASIRDTLQGLDAPELRDLATWLARHVNADAPFTTTAKAALGSSTVEAVIEATAERFGTTVAVLKSTSRHREDVDVRHVAAYAARLCGGSLPQIGRALNQHHTTAMHAIGRIGETPTLRRYAEEIADRIGRHPVDETQDLTEVTAC